MQKYDSFFLFLSIFGFFSAFLCIVYFNIPQIKPTYEFTLSERLNNVYMMGKNWKLENGLFMFFTGIGMIGIIWITDLETKTDEIYKMIKYRLKRRKI